MRPEELIWACPHEMRDSDGFFVVGRHGWPTLSTEASVFVVNPDSGIEVGLLAFHPLTLARFSTGPTIMQRLERERTAPTRGRRARARWRG